VGLGDLFGFAGNFLYGFIPYKAWELVSRRDPVPEWHGRWSTFLLDPEWLKLLAVVALAAGACALVVGWGLNALGFIPFQVLANIVLFNNVSVGVTVAPLLLAILYPRVRRGRLLYRDVMPHRAPPRHWRSALGLALIAIAVIGGMTAGNLLATGQAHVLPVPAEDPPAPMTQATVGVIPFLLLLVLGALLL
jgi:energy-coupling factor transport system substrate-specific component